MLSPMKTECNWWYNSLWRWLPMLKCESLSTTVLFRTTCTLTRMIIFPLLLLSIKSYTLLDYRLPGRGPLQKAYVTLDFISKFLLSFHKVTVGRFMLPVWILKRLVSVFINACHLMSALPSLSQFGWGRLSLVTISFYTLSLLYGPCRLLEFTLAGRLRCFFLRAPYTYGTRWRSCCVCEACSVEYHG